MKKKKYYDVAEFCSEVSDFHELMYDFFDADYAGTAIVGHYDIILKVLNTLVKGYSYTINNADFTEPDYENYEDEYVLIIFDDAICIEKMKHDGVDRYTDLCDYISFIHSDCNSAIIKDSPKTAFVEFDFEEF